MNKLAADSFCSIPYYKQIGRCHQDIDIDFLTFVFTY